MTLCLSHERARTTKDTLDFDFNLTLSTSRRVSIEQRPAAPLRDPFRDYQLSSLSSSSADAVSIEEIATLILVTPLTAHVKSTP